MESITKNGVSTTKATVRKQYSRFMVGAFQVTIYFQYDYRHTLQL